MTNLGSVRVAAALAQGICLEAPSPHSQRQSVGQHGQLQVHRPGPTSGPFGNLLASYLESRDVATGGSPIEVTVAIVQGQAPCGHPAEEFPYRVEAVFLTSDSALRFGLEGSLANDRASGLEIIIDQFPYGHARLLQRDPFGLDAVLFVPLLVVPFLPPLTRLGQSAGSGAAPSEFPVEPETHINCLALAREAFAQ